MKKINGISYSSNLLKASLAGKVHSVFERTINIITEKNHIYTLAVPEIFDGPSLIKVSKEDLVLLKNMQDKKVEELQNGIVINNEYHILLNKGFVYQIPELMYPNEIPSQLNQSVVKINDYLRTELDTVGYYKKSFANDIEKTMHLFLIIGSDKLVSGLNSQNSNQIFEGIKSLVGLGHGLTPSGDDLLTGMSLIMNSKNYPNKEIQLLFNQHLTKLMKNTNLISQNQMKLSMEAQALEPIVLLIKGLFDDQDFENLLPHITDILEIGSSSGSDIISGILLGLTIKV